MASADNAPVTEAMESEIETSLVPMSKEPCPDFLGKAIGFMVILGGIAVLGFVFWSANNLLQTPLDEWLPSAQKNKPSLEGLGGVGTLAVIRIALLTLMTVVGAAVLTRGIHLYTQCINKRQKT